MIDLDKFKTPGQLIQALLDESGWSQRVLAIVLKCDETGINKIILGKRPLDAQMALALSGIFGIPAENFLALQKTYELAQARIQSVDDPDMATRAQLFGSLPISDMVKRGWLEVSDVRDFAQIQSAVTKFFGAASVNEIEIFPHAAKKTNVSGGATPVQIAWLYRVRKIASEMLVSPYSPSAVRSAISKLRGLLISAAAIRKVPKILAECGIHFTIVEALPGSKIDGVCFWLDQDKPVVGMSLRYDRIDNFWFVLRHELEHVIQGHGRDAIMLDYELEGERAGVGANIADEERIANKAAANFCVPQDQLESFISRKAPFFAERDVIGFAAAAGVHPGIVAGQLRHKLNLYNRFTNQLVKIRSVISPGAMVDGWGDIVPVES